MHYESDMHPVQWQGSPLPQQETRLCALCTVSGLNVNRSVPDLPNRSRVEQMKWWTRDLLADAKTSGREKWKPNSFESRKKLAPGSSSSPYSKMSLTISKCRMCGCNYATCSPITYASSMHSSHCSLVTLAGDRESQDTFLHRKACHDFSDSPTSYSHPEPRGGMLMVKNWQDQNFPFHLAYLKIYLLHRNNLFFPLNKIKKNNF